MPCSARKQVTFRVERWGGVGFMAKMCWWQSKLFWGKRCTLPQALRTETIGSRRAMKMTEWNGVEFCRNGPAGRFKQMTQEQVVLHFLSELIVSLKRHYTTVQHQPLFFIHVTPFDVLCQGSLIGRPQSGSGPRRHCIRTWTRNRAVGEVRESEKLFNMSRPDILTTHEQHSIQ